MPHYAQLQVRSEAGTVFGGRKEAEPMIMLSLADSWTYHQLEPLSLFLPVAIARSPGLTFAKARTLRYCISYIVYRAHMQLGAFSPS